MTYSWRRTGRRPVALALAAAVTLAGVATMSGGTPAAQAADPTTPKELTFLAPEYSAGDLTGDHRVDSDDIELLMAAVGTTSATGSAWTAVAKDDVDGDGTITVSDVAALSHEAIYDDGDFDIIDATVVDAQAAMEAGKLTAVQLTQMYLDRIAAYDAATVGGDPATALNSIIAVNPHALEDAAALDAERAVSGPRSMLHGIPVIVKDIYNTTEVPTTAGCKCLDGFVPDHDSEIVERLRAAGAIVLAKANLTEFASGYTGISSYKRSSNAYVPGGESGGSSAGTGAAITANLGMIGLGTDTGGSIQVPGAYQGLADVYQSFGLVSREGITPLAGDQDRGGPLTRDLTDSVIMLDLYAGTDPDDPTTVDADADREDSYASFLDKNGLQGARIGYVSTSGTSQSHLGTNPAIQRIFEEAKTTMAAQGATLVDIGQVKMQTTSSGSTREFGHDIDQWLKTYIPSDSTTYPRNGDELKALLTAHPELSSISSQVIDRINRIPDYDAFMDTHDDEIAANQATINAILDTNDLDAIVYPTVARFGVPGGSGYANVMIASLSGHPSVSVPSGWSKASDVGGAMPATAVGMPTTVSFLGPMDGDGELIKLGYAFEQATHYRTPPARYPDLDHSPATPPAVTGTPTFQVALPWAPPAAGTTASVGIRASNVADGYAYEATVAFDPAQLTPDVAAIESGTSGVTKATVSGSTITVIHTKLGSSPAATGDFTLADIPFTVKPGGDLGSVRLTSVSMVGTDTTSTTYDAPPVAVVHPAQVSSFKTSTSEIDVAKGRTVRVPFVPYGAGAGAAAATVTSSKPGVATATAPSEVSPGHSARVTIKGHHPGTTTVTVTSGASSLVITVKVVADPVPLRSVAFSKKSRKLTSLAVGATGQLKVVTRPGRATGTTVRWKSSSPGTLSVDAAGVVTGIRPGTAVVTARVGSKVVRMTIKVT